MITASLAAAYEDVEIVTIPAPYKGAVGETWEIGIRAAGCASFQKSLQKAEIKARSRVDRIREASGADQMAPLLKKVKQATGKKALKKIETEAAKLTVELAERAVGVDKRIEEIEEVGYDFVNYPDSVLGLDEVATLRDAVARDLVASVTAIAPMVNGKDPERTEWSREQIAADFASTAIVPDVVPRPEDGEDEVEVLWMRGHEEGTALAAWVFRHAVQTHRFLEARVPLGNGSGPSLPIEPIGTS